MATQLLIPHFPSTVYILIFSNKDKTTCTRKEYDDLMYCFVASFANATNSSTTTYQLNWKS